MIRGLIFDYGNTLVAFGPEQQRLQKQAILQVLENRGLQVDLSRLEQLRKQQVLRPYENGGRENDFREVCEEIALLAAAEEPEPVTTELMMARREAFVAAVQARPETRSLLERLSGNYALALLSNYPDPESVYQSLERCGLKSFFQAVVVSGENGFAKPHPFPFEQTLKGLSLEAGECLMIGDNWPGDIQGAKQLGMQALYISEYQPYEVLQRRSGDLEADAEFNRLEQIESWLEAQMSH